MPPRKPLPARPTGANTSFFPASLGDCIFRQRRFDFDVGQWQIAGHLVAQQRADFVEQLAETLWSSGSCRSSVNLCCTSG
jgi:hypothetical protein